MIAEGWVETKGLPKPWPASNARATLPCSQAWMWLASIRSSKRYLLKGITARRRSSAINTIHTKTGTALKRLRIDMLKPFPPVLFLDGICPREEYTALEASIGSIHGHHEMLDFSS